MSSRVCSPFAEGAKTIMSSACDMWLTTWARMYEGWIKVKRG